MPNDFDRLGPDTAFRPRIPKEESIVARYPQSKRLHRYGKMTMVEIPLHWRAYAAHQTNLNGRSFLDAASWGIEAGLNFLLEGDNMGADAVDVDRVIASAARQNRYARSLLAKHIRIGEEVHDPTSYLEARSSLSALQRSMPSAGLSLVVDLAAGVEFSDLAAKHRISSGALRTRAARARLRAREIAA